MRAVIAIAITCVSSAAFAQTGPSFDCRKASTDVEKAICKDRTLSALDRQLARDYNAKLRQLPPNAATALREQQRWFIDIRDARFEAGLGEEATSATASIKESMEERLRDIARIATRTTNDFNGTWSSPMGAWSILRKPNGDYAIRANTVQPVNARWVCDVEGTAQRKHDGTLLLDDSYALSRNGSVLSVIRVGQDGLDGGDSNCGFNGSLEGDYLLTTEDPRAEFDAAK